VLTLISHDLVIFKRESFISSHQSRAECFNAVKVGHNQLTKECHQMEGMTSGAHPMLQRIDALVDFLERGPGTLDSLMNHLLIDTFYGSSAFGHILYIVRNDGSLAMPAKSGFKLWPIKSFPDRFVTIDTPLNRSLRTGEIVSCGSFETFPFAGPDYLHDLFPNGFTSSIAWPVPGVGSVLSFFSNAFDVTEQMRLFLGIVGKTISLALKDSNSSNELHRETHPDHAISRFTLTARQWNVLDAVRRGKTNPEIAQDLGFSESLVRHETMKIYRQLAINGRKELIDLPDDSFPMHLT
jgi:DNA-binding CsgD family transcriptional regulator